MDVLLAQRVGDQRHVSAIEAESGQRQGRGDVGVFRVKVGRFAGAALKYHRGFGEVVQVKSLFGRGVFPGSRRFAPDVVD
ncbi:hypothetical protein D3C84_969910 [compost metagenome]